MGNYNINNQWVDSGINNLLNYLANKLANKYATIYQSPYIHFLFVDIGVTCAK